MNTKYFLLQGQKLAAKSDSIAHIGYLVHEFLEFHNCHALCQLVIILFGLAYGVQYNLLRVAIDTYLQGRVVTTEEKRYRIHVSLEEIN